MVMHDLHRGQRAMLGLTLLACWKTQSFDFPFVQETHHGTKFKRFTGVVNTEAESAVEVGRCTTIQTQLRPLYS